VGAPHVTHGGLKITLAPRVFQKQTGSPPLKKGGNLKPPPPKWVKTPCVEEPQSPRSPKNSPFKKPG